MNTTGPADVLARLLLVAAGLVANAMAQAPSPWRTVSPPGGAQPSAVSASDKLVLYRDGEFLRVFSAVTARWHAHQPSFGTTPVLRDDILLVPESDRWTAFSAYRGVFEVLPIDLAATTAEIADSVAVVRDGGTVHAFSAFTGHWHSHAVPASWSLAVGDRIAVLGDTSSPDCDGVAAFDVYTGQWHDLPAQAARLQPGFEIAGATVLLDFTLYQLGFSGLRPAFVNSGVPGGFPPFGGAPNPSSDLVESRGMFFSGVSGTINLFDNPPFGGFSVRGQVGTLRTASQEYATGIAQNAWTSLPAGASLVGAQDAVALYHRGDEMFGFSAVTNQYDAVNATFGGVATYANAGSTAAVVDSLSGKPSVFSALTGSWHAVPPDTQPGMPWTGRTGVLLFTQSGASAFSARSGAFVPLPGSELEARSSLSGDALVAWDSDTFFAFDARTDRWLSVPLSLAEQLPILGTSTAIAADAVRAVAFGARSGQLASIALSEPALAYTAVGDLAYLRTANQVLAFSGLGDVASWSGFPEDNVAAGIGGTVRYQLRLPQGSVAIFGLGRGLAEPQPVLPFGELWLDPGLSVFAFGSAAAGETRALQSVPIPNVPALRNTEWFLQALVGPQSGAPYLSPPTTMRIL